MTPTITNESEDGVSLDEIFAALSRRARRFVLTELADHNPRTGGEFAPVDLMTNDDDRELNHIQLYHNHLPSLDEAGFIDWDPVSDTITRGPRFESVRPLIELMEAYEDELPDDWP
jgi:hypothetical protein